MTKEKWADFLVCEVHHGDDPDVIESVKANLHYYNINKISGLKITFSKIEVIKALNAGYTFETIIRNDKSYSKGSDVNIVKIDDEEYIRTDRNSTKKDNLDNLPEY
ncbi:Putative uncharacterized protein [Leuconostoc citreum]|nr:Putative uncharacterized protein [Leuconostoc citreum]